MTADADILSRIAAYKRAEVAEAKRRATLIELEAAAKAASPPRGFLAALRRPSPAGSLGLIAEVKKASPSRGLIRGEFDPAIIAQAYETAGARCLSVLTDEPSFMGEAAHLAAARQAVFLPVLRKDFLLDPWQAAQSRSMGADAILVILAMVDDALAAELIAEARRFGMDALVEVHDEAEMTRAARMGADLIGINNRNLRTFTTDLAITGRLAPLAPPESLLVSESGILTKDDVARLARAGARAMLVGESLMRQPDIAAATRALLSRSAMPLDSLAEHSENSAPSLGFVP